MRGRAFGCHRGGVDGLTHLSTSDRALAEQLASSGRVAPAHLAAAVAEVGRSGGRARLAQVLAARGLLGPGDTHPAASPMPDPGASSRRFREAAGGAAGPPPEVQQALASPNAIRVGRYVVVGELGRGGMGVVYRAWDPELTRDVAIKMILDPGGSPARLDRFRREARAVAKLRHRAIVALHEVGDAGGRPYLVMDYVRGQTLDDATRDERLPPRDAVGHVCELARALQHAHDNGILHRDVKPQNVLLGDDGHPHLMDFGLAADYGGEGADSQLTKTGALVGTPLYVAPEQARGDRDAVGPCSDVYGLGGVLYFLLAGRPPFQAETMLAVLQRVASADPEPLRRVDASIHPDLERIALKCLEKEPDRRYLAAADLADDLQRFLEGVAIHARPLGARERLGRWIRRHRALALFGSLAALVVVALLAVVVTREVDAARTIRAALAEAEDGRRAAEREGARARDESERARLAEREARRAALAERAASAAKDELLARALVEKAHRHASAFEDAPAAACFAAASRAARSSREARAGLAAVLGRLLPLQWAAPRRLKGGAVAIDRDGERLAVGEDDGSVRIFDLASGEERGVLNGHLREVAGVAWAPDGARLASVGHDGTLRVWDVARGVEAVIAVPVPGAAPLALGWSPDGTHVAAAVSDGSVVVLDAVGGDELVRLARTGSGPTRAVAFLDADRIVAGGDDGVVWTAAIPSPAGPPATSEPEPLLSVQGAVQGLAVLGRSGSLIAIAGTAGVRLVDGRGDLRADLGDRSARSVASDPSGRFLVAGLEDGAALLADLDGDLERPRVVAGHAGAVRAVALGGDADGAVLAATIGADHRLRLRDAASGAPRGGSDGHGDAITALGFEGSGRHLVSASNDGTVRVWDASTGDVIARRSGGTPRRSVAWSPNGALLAVGDEAGGIRVLRMGAKGADREVLQVRGELVAHDRSVDRLSWSPSASHLVSVSREPQLRVWHVERGRFEQVGELKGLFAFTRGVAWSPDSSRFALGGADGGLQIWNVAAGEIETRLEPPRRTEAFMTVPAREARSSGSALAWSADGKSIATGAGVGRDGQREAIRIWDVASGSARLVLRGHDAELTALAWSPDGRLASASKDGRVRVWRVDSGETMTIPALASGEGGITALAWSADGHRLAAGDAEGGIRVVRAALGDRGRFALGGGASGAAAWAPDGKRLAIAHLDGSILVFEPRGGGQPEPIRLESRRTEVNDLEWHPDGRLLASCGNDGAVRIWDARSGEEVATSQHAKMSLELAWSPDGTRLASASHDRTVRVVDAAGQEIRVIDGFEREAVGVAWGPEGRRVAIADLSGLVRVVAVDTGETELEVMLESASFTLDWSPDGRLLVIAQREALRLLDVEREGALVAVLPGDGRAPPRTVEFDPTGQLIASAGMDGKVRVYSVETRSELVAFRGSPSGSWLDDVCFGPDGRLLTSVAVDGVVTWDLLALGLIGDPDELVERVFRDTGYRVQGLSAVAVTNRLVLEASARED